MTAEKLPDIDELLFRAVRVLHNLGLEQTLTQRLRDQCRAAMRKQDRREIGQKLVLLLKGRDDELATTVAQTLKSRAGTHTRVIDNPSFHHVYHSPVPAARSFEEALILARSLVLSKKDADAS